jgi:hypothetical protein
MKNLIKVLFVAGAFIFSMGSSFAQHKYIGAAKCKMCHMSSSKGAQYQVWKDGPHANAWNVLSPEEQQKPECTKCHSTAKSVDASLLEASITPEEGVSCESCHGPGSDYKSKTVMMDREQSIANGLILPTKEVCIQCHNDESPHYQGFDFDARFKQIAHPRPSGS